MWFRSLWGRAVPLEKAIAQDTFSGGMFRGVARHLIPPNGAYDLLNLLLDDEDGSPYKRGGSAYMSAAAADGAATGGAVAVWDGETVGGVRTLVMGRTATKSRLYVAAADDSTLTALQASGVPLELDDPFVKFAESGGVVAISSVLATTYGAGSVVRLYAGSRKTASYTTGTATVTKDSTAVTGAGTAWLANVDPGTFLLVGTTGGVVKSVESDTALTLLHPWAGATAAGSAYAAHPFSGVTNQAAHGEFVAGRILGTDGSVPTTRMRFSNFGDAGQPNWITGVPVVTDYHEFPGRIMGIHGLRDQALVFTSAGLFSVRNMAFDLTDAAGNPQQSIEKLDGMVLWSSTGVQAWQNALVVPARDGVYLVDGVSRPVLLSGSVSELYRSYVASGYRPGQAAVYRNTYVLPILEADLDVVGWLTCKLDGGDGEGTWPWTRLSAGGVRAVAVRNRADSEPKLLGGATASGARLTLLEWFESGSGYEADADGTEVLAELTTRDYSTGSGQKNTVRKVRVGYEFFGADPGEGWQFIRAGEDGVETTHVDLAPSATPHGSYTWLFQERARYVRFRLAMTGQAVKLVVRSVEGWVRAANRD